MKEINDKQHVLKILKGDKKAFESIVEAYGKTIFNLVYRMINNYEEAKDITQSVFLKAYEKLDCYDPTYKLFSWLYRIAVNECINHNERARRLENLDGDVPEKKINPEDSCAQDEINTQLNRALMLLKIDYRTVIVLKHFNDFSYKEISDLLEIPIKTVKSRLYSGRQMLKSTLIKQGFSL